MAHEAAIDQRVHSRCFVGEQGIQHVRRNTMPACLRFDDQRRELLGAVGMATQLSDADPWYGAPVTPQHTDHIGSQLLPAFFNAVTRLLRDEHVAHLLLIAADGVVPRRR